MGPPCAAHGGPLCYHHFLCRYAVNSACSVAFGKFCIVLKTIDIENGEMDILFQDFGLEGKVGKTYT